MGVVGLVALVAALLLALYALASYVQRRKADAGRLPLPPSPWPCLPFVGHMAFLDPKKPYETVTRWAKRLGPVMRLRFASQDLYVLSDYDVLKEAFTKHGDSFHGRPHIWLLEEMCDGKGLILADGSRWREQRRFSLHRLRDLGFGKSSIEAKIRQESDVMLAQLGTGGTNVDVVKELQYTVANIISSVIYGHSFERGDEQFETFQGNMNESMRIIGIAGALMFFPWLRRVVPGGLGFWKLLESKRLIHAFQKERIAEQKAALEAGDEAEEAADNFVKAFLKEARRGQGEYFDEEQLLVSVCDLFFAGQETTVTTLRWALLFLCRQPDVQRRMRREMREKLPDGRAPGLADRSALPFCQPAMFEAVVLEAQRRGNIIPLGVWHATTVDVELRGFRIPAGATVVPNLWAVMTDEDRFPEPHRSDPAGSVARDDGGRGAAGLPHPRRRHRRPQPLGRHDG